MKTFLVGLAAIVVLLTGCVSGPKYSEFSKSLAPVNSEKGRLVVYRKWKFVALGTLPPVKLNGSKIGDSILGGFFYDDLAPGQYKISTGILATTDLWVTVEKGQTQFVRIVDSTLVNGVMTALDKTIPELVEPAIGEKEIQDCFYTGSNPTK